VVAGRGSGAGAEGGAGLGRGADSGAGRGRDAGADAVSGPRRWNAPHHVSGAAAAEPVRYGGGGCASCCHARRHECGAAAVPRG